MKKFLLIFSMLFAIFTISASNYKHSGYSVKCAKCIEEFHKWPGRRINIAWRTVEPYKKDGDKYWRNIIVRVVTIIGQK